MTASLSPEQKARELLESTGLDVAAMPDNVWCCIVTAIISSRTIAIEEARRAVWDAVSPLLKDLPPHRARDASCYVTAANAADALIRSLNDQSAPIPQGSTLPESTHD